MPNVTSYSGSWILWYAERKSESGEAEIAPPEPLRKVDPIYDNAAVDDRVEGKVQLAAIIHTDGYVYGINVVQGLDPRLDKSAGWGECISLIIRPRSMVILVIHLSGIRPLKCERDAPIPIYPHGPAACVLAPESMPVPAGKVHIARMDGSIQHT